MNITYTKTTIAIITTVATLCLGSVAVFAVPPASQYYPSEILDPLCSPGDANCSVTTGWEFDILNNSIYNDTDFVGIGTDTPTSVLTVVDEVDGVDASGNSSGSEVIRTVNPTENITNSTYTGSSSQLHWNTNETAFNLSGLPMSVAALTGSFTGVSMLGSGDISDVSGFESIVATTDATFTDNFTGNITDTLSGIITRVINTTTGTVENFTGLDVDLNNLAPGNVANLVGGEIGISIAAGAVDFVQGVNVDIENSSGETSNLVSGFRADFDGVNTDFFEPVEITFNNVTTSSNVGVFAVGAGSDIDTAPGQIVSMFNFEGDGTAPVHAVTSSQHIAGLRIWGGDVNSYGLVAENGDAYGVYIGDYGLDATSNQYGLYISDLDASNYLSGGVRLGEDNDSYRLQGVESGLNAELYFGTELIASYTPSDERLKNNINNTKLSLRDLSDIRIVDFHYDQDIIRDNNKQHHGVIAQDLEKIYPNAVKERIDGYKVVDYTALVPLIIKSVQELQDQLTSHAVNLIDNVKEIFVKKVTTEELCVGNRCVTETEFGALLDLLENGQITIIDESDDGADDQDDELDEEIVEDLEDSESVETEENVTEQDEGNSSSDGDVDTEDETLVDLGDEEGDTSEVTKDETLEESESTEGETEIVEEENNEPTEETQEILEQEAPESEESSPSELEIIDEEINA